MTVPSFVAVTGDHQEVANSSLTIPGGISTGNLMVLTCFVINNNGITTPTGWTFERADAGGATGHLELLIATYSRYATSGDPGSTLNVTLSGRHAVILAAYSGVRSASPVAGVASSGAYHVSASEVSAPTWNTGHGSLGQGQNTTLTAPTATPDSADVRVLRQWFGGWDQVTTFPTLTLPATSRDNEAGTLLSAGLSDESLSGSGASGTNTATNSDNGWWVATTLLIGSQAVPTGQLSSGLVVRRFR